MKPWTDMEALFEALRKTESKAEAMSVLGTWDEPALARGLSPADRETAEASRRAAAALRPTGWQGPMRKRPDLRGDGPLFRRGGARS